MKISHKEKKARKHFKKSILNYLENNNSIGLDTAFTSKFPEEIQAYRSKFRDWSLQMVNEGVLINEYNILKLSPSYLNHQYNKHFLKDSWKFLKKYSAGLVLFLGGLLRLIKALLDIKKEL